MNNNKETLRQIFADSFLLPGTQVEELSYRSIGAWDSVGHMALVAAIDEGFGIMLETDDVLDLSSFDKACQILAKYGISCN